MSERWRIRTAPRYANAKVRVARRAERQVGRLRVEQIGVSRGTIARWVADGYLHPELPGVYAVGHSGRSLESNLATALLYAGHGAMLSHATAAWWWGLINYPPPAIHVSTPGRRKSFDATSDRPAVRVHGRRRHVRTYHKGLPVTSVAQTLLDFATDAKRELLRFALANADYHDRLDLRALDAVCGHGAPGSARLREALAIHRPELAYTRSEFERRMLYICEAHQLPIPAFNVYRHGWLLDAVWDQQRLVVELDGYLGHRSKAQLESDHQRDLQLRARGYIVLRYSGRQLRETPDAVAADVRRHLKR